MIAYLKNAGISTKTAIAPTIFFISLVVVGVMSVTSLATINSNVKAVSDDLAKDAVTANRLLDEIYRKRIAMKNYVQTTEERHAETFRQFTISMSEVLAITERDIQAPERKIIVQELVSLNSRYDALFLDQLIDSQKRQKRIYEEDIYSTGKAARESLTQIMTTSYQDNDAVAAYFAGLAKAHLLLARLYTSKYVVSQNDEFYERARAELAQTNVSLTRLDIELQNPTRRQLLSDTTDSIEAFKVSVEEIFTTLNTRQQTIDAMDMLGPQIASLSNELLSSVVRSIEQESSNVSDRVESTQSQVLWVSILALLVSAAVAYIVAKSIVTPILQTSALLQDIAQGNGDLTRRLPQGKRDELGALCHHFNSFADKTQAMIKDIASTTEQLNIAAEEIASVSQQTNEGVRAQKVAVEQIQTDNQMVMSSLSLINQNVQQSSQAADGTSQEADKIMADMSETVATITELSKDIESSNTLVNDLQTESDNIQRVLDLISNITEQINLLALNAAIEAARAGEAGRGFAVVADEVRTLASRTQSSAEEIFSSVSSLSQTVQKTSESLIKNQEQASISVDRAQQAKQGLEGISVGVQNIKQQSDEITTVTMQQDQAYHSVNDKLMQISSAVSETEAASNHSTATSSNISQLSASLQRIVQQFKVA